MEKLRLLSVVIPARDEAASLASTVEGITKVLHEKTIPHEIVVVNDGSEDETWEVLTALKRRVAELVTINSSGPFGFGRAIERGIEVSRGDAVVITMADASDDPADLPRYWELLEEGYDCVFGSRFIKGGGVVGYPKLKLLLNRAANLFLQLLFRISLNDTTNAYKAYRRTTIDGCRPILAPHFNITVELPLKAIVRGYSWKVIPITWRNRAEGVSKLRIREMGSRYLFICLYVWLEKYFSRGDYRKESE